MSSADTNQEQTPEFHRQRYLELKARAQDANTRRPAQRLTENPRHIPAELVLTVETIPGGWYWTCRLARGITLRIVNDAATAGVSALLWNADDPSDRFNPADTVKVQWTARLGPGTLLLSDMGRVLASITDDRCGMHDGLAGGSTPQSNARKYGVGSSARNTRDNFLLAAAKLGLGPRDVGPCATFFAPLVTDHEGRFVWKEGAVTPGDYVDLRAEMDLLVALSNCPHPLSPDAVREAHPVRAILWRSPSATVADFCRTSTEEAVRAFENTDSIARR